MINAAANEKMEKGVVIFNTSRGALIDAEALLEGIKGKKDRRGLPGRVRRRNGAKKNRKKSVFEVRAAIGRHVYS